MSSFPELRPLSEAELRALDASYVPIPSFADWPSDAPRAELWDRLCREFGRLREALSDESALVAARTTVLRTAAFETGAIERLYETDRGLTFTVATQAAAWESAVMGRSADALKLFEAQVEAYEMVLDVATQCRPVTEVWVRQLHELLTGPQETYTVVTAVGVQEQTLPRGQYKEAPNHVRLSNGVHTYAPVDQTRAEMARLVVELQSDAFAQAHPFLQSSYAHYCLVAIHPFADGNGRVARAVASTYLYRAASIPLLVLADQRDEYFRALAEADAGDREPFVAFVGDEARSAIAMIIDALKRAIAPRAETSVAALKSLLVAQGGLTHQELGAIATELVQVIGSRFQQRIQTLDLPPGINGNPAFGANQSALTRPGFRPIPAPSSGLHTTNTICLTLNSAPPADARVQMWGEILISASKDEAETFLVAINDSNDQDLIFGLRDVYPELTVAASYRIDSFVDRLLGVALAELLREANISLGRSGYQVAQYEARIRAGDLLLPIERNSVLAYLRTSDRLDRIGDLAQAVGFTVLPADDESLRALLLAAEQEGFSDIGDLDNFLASADQWLNTALIALLAASPTKTWQAPLPFILAMLVWVGGSADMDWIRENAGGEQFFLDALASARQAVAQR